MRRSVPDLMFSGLSLRRRCGTRWENDKTAATTDMTSAARVLECYVGCARAVDLLDDLRSGRREALDRDGLMA